MRQIRHFLGFLVACTFPGFGLLFAGGALFGVQPAVSKDAIIKAWLGQEKANPAFVATWRLKHTYVKGSLLNPALPQKMNLNNVTAPPEDYSFDSKCLLKVEGARSRYDYQWQTWNVTDSSFQVETRTEVYDGKTNTQFVGRNDKPSTSNISPEAYAIPLIKQQTRAIVLALRPSALPLSVLNFDKLRLAEQRPFLGDVECMLLDCEGTGWRYWVDPNKDYCIVRATLESKTAKIRQSFEIEWNKDQGYWLPRSWQHSVFGANNELKNYTKGFDVAFTLNQPIAATDFAVEYPPNTLIVNEKENSQHVIATDGTKRQVTRTEFAKTSWEELSAPQKHTTQPFLWGVVGIVILATCVLLIVYKKRLFRSKGEM